MTSQGTAYGRFTPGIERRNLFQADLAVREMTASVVMSSRCLERQ